MSVQRLCAEIEGEFAVFLLGMRINQPWKVGAWLPVFRAMPQMVAELERQPELGLLAAQFHGLTQVQYWRSAEHLNAYARNRDHLHLPAWQAFGRRAQQARGAVGIWHETYVVQPGQYETIYAAVPPTGLGRAGTLMPATGQRQSAAGRLGRLGQLGRLEHPEQLGRR